MKNKNIFRISEAESIYTHRASLRGPKEHTLAKRKLNPEGRKKEYEAIVRKHIL